MSEFTEAQRAEIRNEMVELLSGLQVNASHDSARFLLGIDALTQPKWKIVMDKIIWKDLAMRVFWTFAQAVSAVLALDSFDFLDLQAWQTAITAGVAAALAALKGIIRDIMGKSPTSADFPDKPRQPRQVRGS